jgi:hypothetical protein
MADDAQDLIARLIDGDAAAARTIVARSESSSSIPELVAAAVVGGDRSPLDRAAAIAASTRDRQLVAIARAHLAGDVRLLDALVRDHLADHPDQALAAWIGGLRAADGDDA